MSTHCQEARARRYLDTTEEAAAVRKSHEVDATVQCFVSFKDTGDLNDYVQDLNFNAKKMSQRVVLQGIWDEFVQYKDELTAWKDKHHCDQMYFSGFSLGGGVAALAQAYYGMDGEILSLGPVRAFHDTDHGDPIPG